jgi:hypothetical protein
LGIAFGTGTTGNQILGSPEAIVTSVSTTISYVPHSSWGGTVHRVRAVEGPFHVIGIEFARPGPAGTKRLAASSDQMELTAPQGRIARLTIALGEARLLVGALLVAVVPRRLKLSDGSFWSFTQGRIRWIEDAGKQRFTNDGQAPMQLLLLHIERLTCDAPQNSVACGT